MEDEKCCSVCRILFSFVVVLRYNTRCHCADIEVILHADILCCIVFVINYAELFKKYLGCYVLE